jgi:hypothetical protein
MRLVDLLNKMEEAGTLGLLYKAGVVTLAVYSRREVYNTYQALRATPAYIDRPSNAAKATAASCRVARSTVYTAIREMEQELSLAA